MKLTIGEKIALLRKEKKSHRRNWRSTSLLRPRPFPDGRWEIRIVKDIMPDMTTPHLCITTCYNLIQKLFAFSIMRGKQLLMASFIKIWFNNFFLFSRKIVYGIIKYDFGFIDFINTSGYPFNILKR